MTESASVPPETSSHLQAWAASFSEVLGQISGSPLPCALLSEAPVELPPAGEADLWITGVCSGSLRGEMSLRIPPASILRLAQIFMSEPPTPGADVTAEHREATIELLRQVAGFVATTIKAGCGEVHFQLEPAPGAPSWSAASTQWVRAGEEPANAPLVEIHLSAALVAALRSEKTEQKKEDVRTDAKTPDLNAPPADVARTPATSSAVHGGTVNLDLLMDVELAVTLRFGSRRLLLSEILDLNPGIVIDLDRKVEEPVDVLLDGRLVARGEVVVINGNYGLRVTEVTPPAG